MEPWAPPAAASPDGRGWRKSLERLAREALRTAQEGCPEQAILPDGHSASFGPTISPGITAASNSSPLISPSASMATRRVVPSS